MNSNLNVAVKPNSVNHGNVFGTGNWYVFYCPTCKASIWSGSEKCSCGQLLKWEKANS